MTDRAAFTDPFAAGDEQPTFIRPNPGGRGAPPRPTPSPADGAAPEAAEAALPDSGLNPLVALANPLLLAVPQLRATRRMDDPAALRASLAQGVRDFATRAASAGVPAERVMAARYVLCTMLDEAAADTPWGGSGAWAGQSLLALFHNEVQGGEKVFQLMARLAEKPAEHRDLLELIYCALALGFEGRYRLIPNGRAQLEAVRDKLAQILRRERGDYPAPLAQHWQVQAAPRRALHSSLPLAAAAAVAALALAGTYLGLSASLGRRSDAVFADIQRLRLSPPALALPAVAAPAAPPPVRPAAPPRLAGFLQPEIQAGLVAVRDDVDRSIVTLRGDGLFPPGSATPAAAREALLQRIGDALAQAGGAVLVTGHTDSEPIRTARFPSNWHLSEARAQAVRERLIARGVPAGRVRAEGRAAGEPVAPNDSDINRARNRRVEITLFVPGGKG
ncbi:DotU family type VI secretion system protein [Azohydromonas caseinilytica]|uniref:DotU family type VI secretion system protein n=1 Tax=Azohydromonas caseinilytica TaxID=2728836 RepID=A0A848FG87_9BURK|nr:DotU family type VI secretion system protein [Azohydromonas caseinilytica]NML18272.1 DotU family type VI secretion system protein [Azohydromonas caseinilytica]